MTTDSIRHRTFYLIKQVGTEYVVTIPDTIPETLKTFIAHEEGAYIVSVPKDSYFDTCVYISAEGRWINIPVYMLPKEILAYLKVIGVNLN